MPAPKIPLENFIGADRPCEGSAAYQTFTKSFNGRYNFGDHRSGRVVISVDLERNSGSPKAIKAADHAHTTVPVLKVEYGGISVQALNFYAGLGNCIDLVSIAFAADLATVQRRLGATVKTVNAKLQREMADVSRPAADYATLQGKKSVSELVCDPVYLTAAQRAALLGRNIGFLESLHRSDRFKQFASASR